MKKYGNQRKKHMSGANIVLLAVFVVACIVGGVILYRIDHNSMASEEPGSGLASVLTTADQNEVDIGGVQCVPRANLETYLFMGVDARGTAEAKSDYDGTGQSDVLILLVIDRVANTYATLPINRDTITDVQTLDDTGKVLAITKVQIALAHANGDGLEQSCENTVMAVSNLLYGQKIDGYVALNMDAISELNHQVGGVTVTIEDDFSASDPTLKMGETIKLNDDQAMHFVHDRMNVGDGSNAGRMRRQNAYMKGLKEIMSTKSEKFAIQVFNNLKPYMVTSLNGNNVSRISKALFKNEDLGQYQIEGTNAIDDYGYNAFTYDADSLAEIVRELFYDAVK